MLLKKASDIAVDICRQLQPHCYNINIAGSIRRKKADVGDIEVICRPVREATAQASLFGIAAEVAVIKKFEETINSLGEVLMGNPNGRQMKILLPQDIKLDLFIPQDHDYYRIYAVRTGSRQYSAAVIATAWKMKGWCGTDHGLRRIEDCKLVGENKYKLINLQGMKPPQWISEADFFEWLGVSYLNPQLREIFSNSAYKQHKNLMK